MNYPEIYESLTSYLRQLLVVSDVRNQSESINLIWCFVDGFDAKHEEPTKFQLINLLTNISRQLELLKDITGNAELMHEIAHVQEDIHEAIKTLNHVIQPPTATVHHIH